MKYFLFANTEKKPVMRFFDHWFEVNDFLTLMKWTMEQDTPHIDVYRNLNKEELESKK